MPIFIANYSPCAPNVPMVYEAAVGGLGEVIESANPVFDVIASISLKAPLSKYGDLFTYLFRALRH